MFGLGIPELMIIGVIALVVFGPKRLPDLGRSAGCAIAEFKKASQSFQQTIAEDMREGNGPVQTGSAGPPAVRREQTLVPKGVGDDAASPPRTTG